MPAYNFKPRFAPLIENGTKRQTIRPQRKRPTQLGDVLSSLAALIPAAWYTITIAAYPVIERVWPDDPGDIGYMEE